MTLHLTFEQASELEGQLQHWGYNAVDCVATRQVADVLRPRLSERARVTYGFAMACQRPAFAMMRRGIRVDQKARAEVLKELERDVERELARCAEMVAGIWDGTEKETGACPKPERKDGKHKWEADWEGKANGCERSRKCVACGASRITTAPFNANSPAQVSHLLYDILDLTKLRNKKGQIGTCDKDVLQRLAKKYQGTPVKRIRRTRLEGDTEVVWYVPLPTPFPVAELIGWEPDELREGQGILYVKSLAKRRGDLEAELSPDGRYLFSMNIGATWTGRSSSSQNPEKLGGNIQNKAERDRRMFIADPGFEIAYFDYQQAESWIIAYMAQDEKFIEALQSGDVHTVNCRILFPELPWNGDLKKDAKIAKSHYPEWDKAPGHDYRFQTKRISYGWPYGLTPAGAAMMLKLKKAFMEEAFGKLNEAYPGVETNFHGYVRSRVRECLPLVSPLGFEITLLGRPWDDSTFRQGCSAVPQHTVGWLTWLACLRIFDDCDPDLVQVLANVHDAGLFQWRKEHREEAIRAIVERMTIPLQIHGRTCTVPVEGAAGQTWGKRSKVNPNGLEDCYP